MTMTEKLLKLLEIANDGYRFLQIRDILEDIDREIQKGNPLAIQFSKEFDHVLGLCEVATKKGN
jgi:type II secretory pathway component PulF